MGLKKIVGGVALEHLRHQRQGIRRSEFQQQVDMFGLDLAVDETVAALFADLEDLPADRGSRFARQDAAAVLGAEDEMIEKAVRGRGLKRGLVNVISSLQIGRASWRERV